MPGGYAVFRYRWGTLRNVQQAATDFGASLDSHNKIQSKMRGNMITFQPTVTPLGVTVLTTFFVRDRAYVVDMEGTLFLLVTDSDNTDDWYWHFVQQL